MKVKAPRPRIYNEYTVTVKDSSTGTIDEVKAFNTTLPQQVIDYMTREVDVYRDDFYGITHINIGRGVGTPAPTGTSLFDQIARLSASRIEYQLSRALSTATYNVVLPETSYIGETITELGVSASLEHGSDVVYYLLSHALLKDSEGNPISIGPKTDTQTIEINITVHVEIPDPASGVDFVYNELNRYNKGLLIGDVPFIDGDTSNGIPAIFQPKGTVKATSHAMAGNVSTFVASRLGSTEGNGYDICAIELKGIGYIPFPNASIFPTMIFNDENIGAGDGIKTGFDLPTKYWIDGTVEIKVDGVIMTEGVDYSLNRNTGIALNYTGYIPHVAEAPEAFKYDLNGSKFQVDADGYVGNTLGGEVDAYFDLKRTVDADLIVLKSSGTTKVAAYVSNDGQTWTTIRSLEWIDSDSPANINMTGTQFRYLKTSVDGLPDRSLQYVGIYRTCKQIEFTTPPALDAVITASWDTDVPPKNENYSYDVTMEVDWN